MDLNAFYELHARLRAGTVAGAALAAEDFRLKRALEALAPLEGAAPVFRKLGDLTRALLAPDCPDRAGALLDALSLADAVAVTQAAVPVPGEVEPIRLLSRGTAVTNAPHSLLSPLLEALTTSGSGKYSYVVETHEQRPELFQDYRVKDALVKALGASYAELANRAAEWLSQGDESVVPLLKDGFDPQGKKEMARRVEVISALEGAGATPWLLEVLPEAKKDVRAAVLTALGADPDNTALLLDLSKSERNGGSRDAVLKALSKQDGDAVRAFWAEELVKNPGSILFLRDTETEWSGELIAAGLRARLEKMLTKGDRIAAEENENFSRWCQVVGKKVSPAMLDFWRWADEHMETFDRFTNEKGNPVFVGVRLTDTLRECLLRTGSGPLRDFCLKLFDRRPSMTRYLHISFHAALLSCPAAEVYEKYSPYILTKKPLLDAERKKTCNNVLLRALQDVTWSQSCGCHLLGAQRTAQPLDPRWIRRLILAVCRPDGGKFYPFGGGDTVDQFDKALMDLSNPADPEQCTWLAPYLRQRMVETKNWYSYGHYLLRSGGSPRGILGEAMKKRKGDAALYYVWVLLNEASKSLPAEEVAGLCQEALDTERFRPTGNELYLAKKVLPWTIERLRAGDSFPEWDEWWNMRK